MANKVPIEVSADLKLLYHNTAKKLRVRDRRQFMAQLVKQWGRGGYTFAEKELGWNQYNNEYTPVLIESGVKDGNPNWIWGGNRLNRLKLISN